MAGKIFISCGQANLDEVKVANDVSNWLTGEGFHPYVAIETQTILDVNGGIISELKNSDYYLFINFRRNKIIDDNGLSFFRGSIFTNQEMGIAYAMGFEKMLFINQKEVRREGIFGYLVSNTPEFENYDEVLPVIQKAIVIDQWKNTYSRNLEIQNLHWGSSVSYKDHTGRRNVKVLHIDVFNNRPDTGATNTVCRLRSISRNKIKDESPDKSNLKCSGSQEYSKIILPNDHITFDLLSIDLDKPSNIYLHSALDVNPRVPIITIVGKYELEYEIFAMEYHPITFIVELDFTDKIDKNSAKIK